MYTVSKNPIKIVAKTRRGMMQNLDRLDSLRDSSKKSHDNDNGEIISEPKPVFQQSSSKKPTCLRAQQAPISPQHEELIKFIYESWNSICKECNTSSEESSDNTQSICYYDDGEPNPSLQDFKPIDLELWWGKQLFNTLMNSS
ncbi:unnamed protein product [Bemisia tabaci]|uniref:Uncharacterized protein n=1 Tax=Bemisia tabaci TaxID=7038 RepID=A0A9P0AB32_BEMTA|nr:PREDICTED: protein FAM195B [Bemisia tabaci]CAH0389390.1 unnamed protein product [Bemisia tabaci]